MTDKRCGKPENYREKVLKVRDNEGVNRYKEIRKDKKRVDDSPFH